MRLLILIILPLLGCTPNVKNKSVIEGEREVSLNQLKEGHFDVFLKEFKREDLPFNLTTSSASWINFSEGKPSSPVIPRNKVKKYFYANSDEQLKESNFDQFYYGSVFEFSRNLMGVTYYGTSKEEDGISGYELVLFDKHGIMKNTLLIAGTRGIFDVDLQVEAKIEKTRVVLSKIELDLDKVQDLDYFEGKQKFITYQISNDGVVNKVNETDYVIKILTAKEDKNYRIEVVN